MTVQFLQGDVRTSLKTLPDKSVHCVVTSPPYWGLRDYGVAGQLGLEATPQEYVENMVAARHGRNAILCELNPDYVAMSETRLADDRRKQMAELL